MVAKKKAAKKKVAKKPAKKGGKKKSKKKASSGSMTFTKAPIVAHKTFTKGEMMGAMAGNTGLSRTEVSSVMDSFTSVIEAHLKKQGPGVFVLPGLLKVQVVTKPATPARTGVNPFTGQPMMVKAKPARKVVKVRALKKLKAMV